MSRCLAGVSAPMPDLGCTKGPAAGKLASFVPATESRLRRRAAGYAPWPRWRVSTVSARDSLSAWSDCPAAVNDHRRVLAVALCSKPREVNPGVDPQLCEHMAQVCVHGVR